MSESAQPSYSWGVNSSKEHSEKEYIICDIVSRSALFVKNGNVSTKFGSYKIPAFLSCVNYAVNSFYLEWVVFLLCQMTSIIL